MQVFELHLAVDQRLQEVASFKRNKYYPEEIDAALNKSMFRLLQDGVNKKFQNSQIPLTAVSGLTEKNRFYDLIIPASNDLLNEPGILSQYCVLPADLYWTINTRVETLVDPLQCGTPPDLGTLTQTEYVATLRYPTVVGGSPFYANLTIASSLQGSLYTTPVELASGITELSQLYILTDNVVEFFYRNRTVRVYWERYRDIYYKNQFVVVSNSPLGNVTISATGYASVTVAATATTYTVYNRNAITSLPSYSLSTSTPRVHEQDTLYQGIVQNRYYAPKLEEPLITQTLDYFIVYRDKSYILTRLWVDYIRKPRTISLSLNQGCELSDATHQKVVDLAVEILRLDIKDPAYQLSVQDTELRS